MFKSLMILFSLLIPISLYATPTVNILSWWGYLDDPQIKTIVKNKCGVDISYDEYDSNQEFLSRFEENKDNYNVIIFSDIMYGVINKQIAMKNSDLYKASENYPNFIKKHYLNSHYPNNIAYFSTSIMGFLWNPALITLNSTNDIIDAFKRASGLNVVLIDDPMEVNNIIGIALQKKESKNKYDDHHVLVNYENLEKVTQNSHVYITNDYGKIYSSPSFAFSYLWSGDAFYDMQQQAYKYKFLANKSSSYICTDLIAQLDDNQNSACVAKVLSSREVLNIMQNSDFYFSPYGDATHITNKKFKEFYDSIFPQMQNMPWIGPVSINDYYQMQKNWKEIKLKLNYSEN